MDSPIHIDVLRQFTNPDHALFKDVLACEHYRGDLTQSGDDRLRLAMGEDRYANYHWDTIACTGGIMIVVPRFKHPEATERKGGVDLPAPYWWCFDQIERNEECSRAAANVIFSVIDASREALSVLPGFEFITVRKVLFWSHGRGPAKKKSQPPPEGVVFFKFTGGVGCVASVKEKV